MGQYASQITGLREFLHEELIKLGLTTPEQIEQANQPEATSETGTTSEGQHSTEQSQQS